MKHLLFFFVLVIFSAISGGHSRSETSETSLTSRIDEGSKLIGPTTSLIKYTPDNVIFVTPDGMVYLVEPNSRKIIWSFKSGPPLYSSSKTLDNYGIDEGDYYNAEPEFFLDYGKDGNLYLQGPNSNKVKIPSSDAEELINRTPFVTKKGSVIIGSKNATVFEIDPETGVIYSFKPGDYQSKITFNAEGNPVILKDDFKKLFEPRTLDSKHKDQSFYVLRKDYTIEYFLKKTRKWSLTFSVIEASLQSQEIYSFSEYSSSFENDMDSERKDSPNLPFNAASSINVHNIQDINLLESILMSNGVRIQQHRGTKALPVPVPDEMPGNQLALPPNMQDSEMPGNQLALPPNMQSESVDASGKIRSSTSGPKFPNKGSLIWGLLVFMSTAVTIFCLRKLGKVRVENNVKTVTVKKKKTRKSAMKNGPITEKINENTLKLRSTSNPIDEGREFYKVGNFLISNKEIAKGSNGTVILEGIHDGRQVAIKRLVQTHYGVAEKEVQNLIMSDCHPNIVRLFGFEYDQYFAYLSLERCTCNLSELIFSCLTHGQNQDPREDQEQRMKQFRDIELWKPNGQPSAQLLKLLRDIVSGLSHLHELGIIHRDLKPQNILIVNERYICAKISDMGISKCLPENTSSLTQSTTGLGSSGWQAPEQLNSGRHTQAIDLFSLGCILFFCLTGGKHPFGDIIERDANIVYGRKDLFLLESNPEATDLIDQLLDPNPELRPKAMQLLNHPFFWNSDKRLSFLCGASDRVELENRENESKVLDELESISYSIFGGRWDDRIDDLILDDIGRYRRYSYNSVRDLLRLIRNKHNHYRALSTEVEEILGPIPDGFDNYFSTRFPNLLIRVYKVLLKYCNGEASFRKYFETSLLK